MTLRFLKPLTAAVSVALLTACAGKTATTAPVPALINHQDSDPKTFLQNATSERLKSAFAYRSDIYVANGAQTDVSVNLAPKEDCDSIHDKQYVAVLKRAKQDKLQIDDERYKDDLKTIKKEYHSCQETELAQESYTPFDFQEFHQNNKDLSDESKSASFMAETAVQAAEAASVNVDDDTDKTLQLKKAQLLNAYLLKPTSMSVVGRYEPLSGKFTALPSVGYQSRNMSLVVNQPLYVDLKAGGIYLWADNFALANSQWLDKKLGDRWYQKWLFLPLNDGSLPADFGENLLKAYVQAKKESHLAKPTSSFAWVDAKTLTSVPFIKENLPSDTLKTIQETPYIIKNTLSAKDKAYSDYVFYDVFYQTLTKKYPELTLENSFGTQYERTERDIIDGESVIRVANLDKDNAEPKETDEQPMLTTNSKMLMVLLLSHARSQVDGYYATLSTSQNAPPATKDEPQDSKYAPLAYYGFSGGKLSWVHYRQYLTKERLLDMSKDTLSGEELLTEVGTEPVFVDVFTKLNAIKDDNHEFARLPVVAQTPNAQNSVNLLDYKEEFLQSLKSSDDKYLQLLVALLMGSDKEDAQETKEAYPEPVE